VQTLALTVSGTVDLAALARDTGATGASQAGPALQVGLAGGADLAAPAAAVLSWLAGHGHEVSQLASNPATLEDVFLALTGRQLRD
jgi:hypothetical protein